MIVDSAANHWLDCLAYACAGARSKYCGVSISVPIDESETKKPRIAQIEYDESAMQPASIPFY